MSRFSLRAYRVVRYHGHRRSTRAADYFPVTAGTDDRGSLWIVAGRRPLLPFWRCSAIRACKR